MAGKKATRSRSTPLTQHKLHLRIGFRVPPGSPLVHDRGEHPWTLEDRARSKRELRAEIAGVIGQAALDAWQDFAIDPKWIPPAERKAWNEQGYLKGARVRSIVNRMLGMAGMGTTRPDEYQLRTQPEDESPDPAESNTECHYVWINERRECYYDYPLEIGTSEGASTFRRWRHHCRVDRCKETADFELRAQLQWSISTKTDADSSGGSGDPAERAAALG